MAGYRVSKATSRANAEGMKYNTIIAISGVKSSPPNGGMARLNGERTGSVKSSSKIIGKL